MWPARRSRRWVLGSKGKPSNRLLGIWPGSGTRSLINAVWDLYAKAEGKPLWKLLVDMTPEQLVSAIPFRYITDALTREDALGILRRQEPTRLQREAEMREHGYPAYTTSAGWL